METLRSAFRLRLVGIVVATLTVLLAGCASTQPASPAVREPGSAATGPAPTLTARALDLAVRAEPYQEEQLLLSRAERVLTRGCMIKEGYPYPVTGTDAVLDDPWRPDLDGRRRHGYGFAQPSPSTASQYPPGLTKSQRAAYARALSGDSGSRATLRLSSGPRFTFATTGCIAESRVRLYGDAIDAARVDYVPQETYNALLPHVTNDPDMHKATRKWSQCMHGRGHPYASTSAARAAASSAHNTGRPAGDARQFEIQVAVADGECALAVGFPQLMDELGRRHADNLTADQRRDLNTAADLRAAGLRRARSIT